METYLLLIGGGRLSGPVTTRLASVRRQESTQKVNLTALLRLGSAPAARMKSSRCGGSQWL